VGSVRCQKYREEFTAGSEARPIAPSRVAKGFTTERISVASVISVVNSSKALNPARLGPQPKEVWSSFFFTRLKKLNLSSRKGATS
jgi:hypothetical protein